MSFLQSKFPEGRMSRGKHGFEWQINCPWTERHDQPDTKRRLSINLANNLVYCHRCGYKAHVRKFLWELDRTFYEVSSPRISLPEMRKRIATIKLPASELKAEMPNFRLLSDPGPYRNYAERLEAYLWDRGWTEHDIEEAQVGFILEKRWLNRLIFPFYNCLGRVVFWQGRTIVPETEPKYLNPSLPRDEAIYNMPMASNYRQVVLVEGLFDCVLPNNAGTLSADPTDGQILTISRLWDEIVVMYDRDAYLKSWKAAERLSAFRGKTVKVARCPAKDPDEASLHDIEIEIDRAIPFSKTEFLKIKLSETVCSLNSEN